MDYRYLGRSGLKVSRLCLGTMMFGDQTDGKEAERIVANAWENGVNYIDTADQYAKGESERIVGKLIASTRDWWVLATKVGNPMGDSPNEVGLSRKWIMRACEASLMRMGTEYIDIYYLHLDYEDIPLEEMVGAMGDLIRSGKIRYFGVSNFRAWRMAEMMHLCRTMGVPKPVVCQPYYNAMNRQPELEVLPTCQYYGIGITPYSPIARGVLTGKYSPGKSPKPNTRAGRKDPRMMETEFREESLKIAGEIVEYAEGLGMSAGQFAVAWVLSNKLVDSVIGGPRTIDQWKDYYKALDYNLTLDDEAFVDNRVSPGHPSTPGYNDPKYPLRGRVVNP